MKKFFVLLLIGVVAALAIWFGIRARSSKISSSAVTALLPKETLALVIVPDFNASRAQWHQTEIYKLWKEPAMQEFMQKPLTQVPQADAARAKLQQIETLEMKDAFLAVTAVENHQPKILAGFRFKGSEEDAEKVISQWRSRAQRSVPEAKRETVTYESHKVEVMTEGDVSVGTVYDGNWFFAASDMATLKALLDRVDGRTKDAASTLAEDENFKAAFKHMPPTYAALAYGRLDRFTEKIAGQMPQDGSAKEQIDILRKVRGICATTGFESGKVHDVLFVTMPKVSETGDLKRSSLALATKDSFLYAASFLNLPKAMPTGPGAAGSGFPAAIQTMLSAFAAKGITLDYWKSAFGSEFGIIGDWPANARIPSLFATMPVTDATKAKAIMKTATDSAGEGATWTASEKDGVQYYSQPPENPMIPVGPTIGLSDKTFVAGLDMASVEAAIKRAGSSNSELANADAFKSAEHLVPTAKQSFVYIDTALLYTRLDAAVRPMLIMAAAFMPKIAETVDLGKLPAADVITKHLSPIVMSQSYDSDGYLTDSMGPVSIYQAVVGLAVATGAGTSLYQNQMHPGGASIAPAATATPEETPDMSPSPAPESEETPEPTESPTGTAP